jgi:DNA-binding Lrp family transcriptional regulator
MIGKNFSEVEEYVQSLRVKKHISSANTRLIRVISKSYTSFLEEKDKELTYFKAGEHRYNQNFDNTDSKIITELINNSRITNIDFGKKVSLNHVTIKTRINKLLNEKIIDKFTVAIKYNKLPGRFVRMTLRKRGSMFTKKMTNLLAKHSEEAIILAPYFSQERIIFLRTKNDEKLMTTISEINKLKDITITSVSENIELLKNKIF